MFPPNDNAWTFCHVAVSRVVQGSRWKPPMPPEPERKPLTTNGIDSDPLCWSIHAFTPSAYAWRSARVAGDIASRSRCAAIRQPRVRMYVSVEISDLPNSSDRRLAPIRLEISICHIRSWAWA